MLGQTFPQVAATRLRVERLPVIGVCLRARNLTVFPSDVLYGDIVRGLPVVDSTASGVYCSHVLEHLDRVSAVVALKNTLAMFEPGGTFRLVVPTWNGGLDDSWTTWIEVDVTPPSGSWSPLISDKWHLCEPCWRALKQCLVIVLVGGCTIFQQWPMP